MLASSYFETESLNFQHDVEVLRQDVWHMALLASVWFVINNGQTFYSLKFEELARCVRLWKQQSGREANRSSGSGDGGPGNSKVAPLAFSSSQPNGEDSEQGKIDMAEDEEGNLGGRRIPWNSEDRNVNSDNVQISMFLQASRKALRWVLNRFPVYSDELLMNVREMQRDNEQITVEAEQVVPREISADRQIRSQEEGRFQKQKLAGQRKDEENNDCEVQIEMDFI